MKENGGKSWLMLALSMAFVTPAIAADVPVGSAAGDAILAEPEPESWGGTHDSVVVVGPHTVLPSNPSVTWNTSVSSSTGLALYQTSTAPIDWWRLVHIPTGALLQRLEMEACDTSITASIQFGVFRGATPGLPAGNIMAGTTGGAAAPGCAFYSVTPSTPTTIDNRHNNYWIFFGWAGSGLGIGTRINAFRVFYRLQVSPAPAIASFPNDVPTTHPFFRFIEALRAAGISGGCAPDSFCPDNPVTRGEMAVFLAAALGLHFAP